MYVIDETKTAVRDRRKLKSASKATKQRLQDIVNMLTLNPYEGTGDLEQLKYDLSGRWSRELTKKDRVVFSVDEIERIVTIYQYLGHYTDK